MADETSNRMASSKLVDERMHSTTDARVWAEEFCAAYSLYTEEGVVEDKAGLMLTWFANAIEIGRTDGERYLRALSEERVGSVLYDGDEYHDFRYASPDEPEYVGRYSVYVERPDNPRGQE